MAHLTNARLSLLHHSAVMRRLPPLELLHPARLRATSAACGITMDTACLASYVWSGVWRSPPPQSYGLAGAGGGWRVRRVRRGVGAVRAAAGGWKRAGILSKPYARRERYDVARAPVPLTLTGPVL